MEMGSGYVYFKIILYFALALFSLGAILLPFISFDAPEFVVVLMILVINGTTAAAAFMYLRYKNKK